jgi:hypothetical protein
MPNGRRDAGRRRQSEDAGPKMLIVRAVPRDDRSSVFEILRGPEAETKRL